MHLMINDLSEVDPLRKANPKSGERAHDLFSATTQMFLVCVVSLALISSLAAALPAGSGTISVSVDKPNYETGANVVVTLSGATGLPGDDVSSARLHTALLAFACVGPAIDVAPAECRGARVKLPLTTRFSLVSHASVRRTPARSQTMLDVIVRKCNAVLASSCREHPYREWEGFTQPVKQIAATETTVVSCFDFGFVAKDVHYFCACCS